MTSSLASIGAQVRGHRGDSAGQGASRLGTPEVRDPTAASGFFDAAARPWLVRCARRRTQPGQFSISVEILVVVDDGRLSRVETVVTGETLAWNAC